MDYATQNHLTTLRDLLNYRLHELEAEVHSAEAVQRQEAAQSVHEVVDQKDEAANRQQSEIEGAQERRDVDEMADVKAALRRLDEGSYGDCADCGEPIPLSRLLVQPAALRCAACQSEREHASARSVAR